MQLKKENKLMRNFASLWTFFLCLIACKEETPIIAPVPVLENLQTTVAYQTIPEIDPNLAALDIYYNSELTKQRPVVIYVHGGAWSIGDKASQMDNKIQFFRSLDYVLVSINYRLSPNPADLLNPNRIKFPIHNQDVATAIKWVHENIQEYGGDADKMALLGHSAGAHLVSLTGTNSTFLGQNGLSLADIKGVAAIDTEGYDVLKIVQEDNLSQFFYINAFGVQEAENIAASPIYQLETTKSYPKFFIAKRGSPNRIEIADNFITALSNNQVSVVSIDGSIYDHEGINEAIGAVNESLISPALEVFFKDCFK